MSAPRHGLVGGAQWEFTQDDLGGDEPRSVLAASFGVPVSFGALTVFPSVEAGSTIEGANLIGGEFFLGGFQRLSGLQMRELSGNHYALGVLNSYYQLTERTTQFELATYVGGTLELGGIWQDLDGVSGSDLLLGGSVFVGADSFIGPAYLAFGLTEGGNESLYVFMGPTF